LWEIPAGKLDPGEPPEVCARRELEEESGYKAEELVGLGSILMTPGFCDERIHLYLARGLKPGTQALEHNESLVCETLPFVEALRMAVDGDIDDAKTAVALMRARKYVERA
jgi:ADP-ribose pyrophosphatase